MSNRCDLHEAIFLKHKLDITFEQNTMQRVKGKRQPSGV